MWLMKIALALLLVCLFSHSFISALAQTKYKTYSNARFSYSISYPSDLLEPQGEATNRDGQKFLSKDGEAEMLVYGRNKLDGSDTLKKNYDEAISGFGGNISYKVLKRNWFVISGKRNGKIFYQKTILRRDNYLTFSIEYDESKSSTYDAATTKIVKSFIG